MLSQSTKSTKTTMNQQFPAVIFLGTLCFTAVGCGGGSVDSPVVGQPVPKISFVSLSDGGNIEFSDFRGRIVVAEFWASWCQPCQEPMAKMQAYEADHPEWRDRVALVTISIDDVEDAAKQHLEQRSWDKTVNLWADPRRGKNSALIAYAGKGIPMCYVLDAEGVLAKSGNPNNLDIPTIVDQLLQRSEAP